jgi:Protein of unknown function (DUF3800)
VTADVLSIPKLLLAPRFSEVARKQELPPNRFNGNNILDESSGSGDDESSGYSEVRHYASAVFPFSDRQKWMMVVAEVYQIAYMDETGHAADDNQHFCGMAGFLATADRWEILEGRWKQTLKRFDVDYMHMKEYGPSTGIFKSWKGDERKRKAFFGELLSHLRDIRAIPFGSIYSLDAYRGLSKEDREILNEPYLKSLADCVGIPALILDKEPPEVKYGVVFSEQAEFKHRAAKTYDLFRAMYTIGERMMYPDFKDMRCLVALQAADIIAYELSREFGRQLRKPTEKPRYGYSQIFRMAYKTLPFTPFLFYSETKIREFISYVKSASAAAGASGNFAGSWRELYSQELPELVRIGLPIPEKFK